MDLADLPFQTVETIAPMLRSREVSPVELMDASLERIERLDPIYHGFITVDTDRARQRAQEAEHEIARGGYRGPMHGIPVAHKDTLWTAGLRTTSHSRLYRDWVPDVDATVVARLSAAGAITIGKANTHEFACGDMSLFGDSVNPWDLTRVTGGSSSGSAGAVAAHLAMTATGTDSGGSIRVPAAFCGIVGLKPTYGRVSRFGQVTLSQYMAHVGPMTKTVGDAAFMLAAMAGQDPRDSSSSSRPVPDYHAAIRDDLQGIRLGIPRPYFFDGLDQEVARLVEAAIDTLRQLGAEIVDVEIPLVGEADGALYAITFAEAASAHERNLREHRDGYGENTWHRLAQGFFISAMEYVRAMRMRQRVIEVTRAVFAAGIHALVSPVAPYPAYKIDRFVELEYDDGRLTRLANLTGRPSMSVPCGFTADGLPVAIQVTGSPWREEGVFRVAGAYERATNWFRIRPPELSEVAAK
jgi:aspartyl-tRNA(Asn)/glutamyl-tRNA(Gln) amidotransferase subunit A